MTSVFCSQCCMGFYVRIYPSVRLHMVHFNNYNNIRIEGQTSPMYIYYKYIIAFTYNYIIIYEQRSLPSASWQQALHYISTLGIAQ